MGASFSIRDGEGTNQEAKVRQTGPLNEKALWVHLADIGPKVSLPIFAGPVGGSTIYDEFLKNGGSEDMNVDGSTTAVEFEIAADAEQDLIITRLIWAAQDSQVKMSNFMSANSPLTAGILVEFKSDDKPAQLPLIKTTHRLLAFSSGDSDVITEASTASVTSYRNFQPALIIRKQGSHTGADDFIRCTIQDDLTFVNDLTLQARGFLVESGVF